MRIRSSSPWQLCTLDAGLPPAKHKSQDVAAAHEVSVSLGFLPSGLCLRFKAVHMKKEEEREQ